MKKTLLGPPVSSNFADNLDVPTSFEDTISEPNPGRYGNTSGDATKKVTYRLLLDLFSQHYCVIYVSESEYRRVGIHID